MEINSSDKNLEPKRPFVKNNMAEEVFKFAPNPIQVVLNKDKVYYGTSKFVTTVKIQDIGPPVVSQGILVVFVKFQKLILDQDKLYVKLLLFKETETPPELHLATKNYLRTFAEATREGLFIEVEFILIPAVVDKIYPPFGNSYKTVVPVPITFTLVNLANVLIANKFMFDGNQYNVKPGSIKQKKSKKTTNTFG